MPDAESAAEPAVESAADENIEWRDLEPHLLAFVGGMGLGSLLLMFAGFNGLLWWALLAVWISAAHRRILGLVGLWASLGLWVSLYDSLAERAPVFEVGPMSLLRDPMLLGVGIAAGGVYVISLVFRIGTHNSRILQRASASVGLVGVVAIVVSSQAIGWFPASESFEMSFPPGWTRLEEPVYGWDSWAYGQDLSAVYGGDGLPEYGKLSTLPVIGVSAVRYETSTADGGTAEGCHQTFMGWGFGLPTRSLDWDAIEPAPNPRQDAYAAGLQEPAGTRFYTYTITRTRLVGALTESLCYYVAFTLPPNGTITAADVSAIFATFRFR